MLNWKWELSLAASALAAVFAEPAFGQEAPAVGYSRAPQAVAADYYAGSAAQQATIQPASCTTEPACGDPSACTSCDTGCTSCDTGCGTGYCGIGGGLFGPCCEKGAPWTLFEERCNGLTMGGWLSGGYYANQYGAPTNGPVAFRQIAEELTLNQAWFYAEKLADGECGLDFGYRVDYVFGTDGPDTQAFGGPGYDTDWDTSSRYGSALPQLYGQVAYGDLSVKMGHFYTIIGYEVVQATGNFFTSHSYTMNYGEPFTHTGVLAEYAANEDVTFYGGWTLGWDTGFESGGNGNTVLGGVGLQLTEDIKATYAANAGDYNETFGGGQIYMQSFVVNTALTERTEYVFQTDYARQNLVGADNYWYGINQYLFYTINDCWRAGARMEWFDDNDGVRVGSGPGDYYALTAGLNWTPTANVTVRPELRYDDFDGKAGSTNPFNGGADSDQFSGGFDIIYTY